MSKRLLKVKAALFSMKNPRLTPLEERIRSVVLSDSNLSLLSKYKEHRRLKVFNEKGVKCCNCRNEGIRLIHHCNHLSATHIDLYTRDLVLMTVDHIVPKSFGGNSSIENLRPMCELCNSRRGNHISKNDLHEILKITSRGGHVYRPSFLVSK